ncbi:MAG TPA: BrnT family toxin [Anaerolineae bacterium]|nr:BrnT family toxin [Anaerolineae bacterium]
MKISNIIWLVEVEEKIISKHHVWPDEVEQVLQAKPHVRFMERGHRPGEDLYAAFGRTDSGRYLAVYFILKRSRVALIVTARDMTNQERRTYGKKR